jgi:hypothetical protein
MQWIIEENVFDEDLTSYLEDYIVVGIDDINYCFLHGHAYGKIPKENFIFRGSISGYRKLQKCSLVFAQNDDNFRQSELMRRWSMAANLNQGYLLPLKEAFRRGGTKFVRPNNSFKSFDGQVIDLDNTSYIDFCFRNNLTIEEVNLSVISNVNVPKQEFRCLVSNGHLVTHSLYKGDENLLDASWILADIASDLDTKHSPESSYFMDIAFYERDGSREVTAVLEACTLSTACIYDMDPEDYIKVMEVEAKEYFGL